MGSKRAAADELADARPAHAGLSGKIFVLTLLFVLSAGVMIYVPAITLFRLNWLNDRVAVAHTAALALQATPGGTVPRNFARQILASVGVKSLAMKMGGTRRQLAMTGRLPAVARDVDLRDVSTTAAIVGAFETLFCNECDLTRVIGPALMAGDYVEIVIEEAAIREAMLRLSASVLSVLLFVSAIPASFLHLALLSMLVRPMRWLAAKATHAPRPT